MNKLKAYGSLVLALVLSFNIGYRVTMLVLGLQTSGLFITIIMMMYFTVVAVENIRKL